MDMGNAPINGFAGPMFSPPPDAPWGSDFGATAKPIEEQQEERIKRLQQQLDQQWGRNRILTHRGRIMAGDAFEASATAEQLESQLSEARGELSFREAQINSLKSAVERRQEEYESLRNRYDEEIEQASSAMFDLIEDAADVAAVKANQQDGRWPEVKPSLVKVIYAAESIDEYRFNRRIHTDGANDFIVYVLQTYDENGVRYDEQTADEAGLNDDGNQGVEDVQGAGQGGVSEAETPTGADADPAVSDLSGF